MPNKLTLDLLRSGPEGIAEWNRLRAEGAEVPLFYWADLFGLNLRDANFRNIHFYQTSLEEADLCGTDLAGASFTDARVNRTKIDAKWFQPDAEVYGLPVIVEEL